MAGRLKFGRYDYAAFLCFISYAMCSIIIPVSLVPIAGDLRFPLTEGGMGLGGILQVFKTVDRYLIRQRRHRQKGQRQAQRQKGCQ